MFSLTRSMAPLLADMMPSDVSAFLEVLPQFRKDLALEVLGILMKEPTAVREYARLITTTLPETYTAEQLKDVLHQVAPPTLALTYTTCNA
jgi:hypothetical protein